MRAVFPSGLGVKGKSSLHWRPIPKGSLKPETSAALIAARVVTSYSPIVSFVTIVSLVFHVSFQDLVLLTAFNCPLHYPSPRIAERSSRTSLEIALIGEPA